MCSLLVSGMSKKHYAILNKQLKEANLTLAQHKENPLLLCNKNDKFAKFFVNKVKSVHEDFTWYGKNVSMSKLYSKLSVLNKKSFEEKLTANDKSAWIADITTKDNIATSSTFDENIQSEYEEAETPVKSPAPVQPPKGKTKDQTKVKNPKKIESVKKKLMTNVSSTETTPEDTAGNTDASKTTNQQIDNSDGNDHNTGGTCQGESGSRKEQKRKKWSSEPIVSMAYKNSIHCFYYKLHNEVDNPTKTELDLTMAQDYYKEEIKDLTDTINFIYPDSAFYGAMIEVTHNKVKQNFIYLLWQAKFNIGTNTILKKIGNRFKNIMYQHFSINNLQNQSITEDTSYVKNYINQAFNILVKNDKIEYTLDECAKEATLAQERRERFNSFKRKLDNNNENNAKRIHFEF